MPKISFFEVLLSKITATEGGDGRLYTFVNPYSYLQLRKNCDIVGRFSKIYCDGILLVIFLRIIGFRVERKSFDSTSMAVTVIKEFAKNKKNIYLVGGVGGVADAAAQHFSDIDRDIKVCGTRSGYFLNNHEYEEFVSSIVSINPDLVIVGMGAPKQEKMLIDLADAGWHGIGYTCGGYFHQTAASGVKYYPDWIDRANLRWAYRIFDEPKLVRRYTLEYGKFVFVFAYDFFSHKILKIFKK